MENEKQSGDITQLVEQLTLGKTHLDALDLTDPLIFEAAIRALRKSVDLVKGFVIDTPEKEKLIITWVEEDYKRITCLAESQLTSEIINAYFIKRMQDTYIGAKEVPLGNMCYSSYDKSLILVLTWETTKTEVLRYFDKELGVPAELRGKVCIKIKITDAMKLLKAVDIDLRYVDFQYIAGEFRGLTEKTYREVLFEVMDEKNAGYLTLGKYFTQISRQIKEKLSYVAAEWGVEIKDAEVKEIDMPSNLMEIVRQEYINISRERSRMDFEQTVAENSLKNYEKKAEIHSKYPQFQMTLTEAEKDNALDRYLKRVEKYKKEIVDVKDKQLQDDKTHVLQSFDEVITEPTKPVKPVKSSILKKFFIWLAVFLAAGVGGFFIPNRSYIGFIVIAATVVIFGIYAATHIKQMKEAKNYPHSLAKYNEEMTKYTVDYAEYQRKLEKKQKNSSQENKQKL